MFNRKQDKNLNAINDKFCQQRMYSMAARSESCTWRLVCSLALLHWCLHVAERRLELLIYSICDPSDQWRAQGDEYSSPHFSFGGLSYCTPYWGLCKGIVTKHCQRVPRPWKHRQSSSHFPPFWTPGTLFVSHMPTTAATLTLWRYWI